MFPYGKSVPKTMCAVPLNSFFSPCITMGFSAPAVS
jgi:hypothetical protein